MNLKKKKTNIDSVEAYAMCFCAASSCSCSCGLCDCYCSIGNSSSIDGTSAMNRIKDGRNLSAHIKPLLTENNRA